MIVAFEGTGSHPVRLSPVLLELDLAVEVGAASLAVEGGMGRGRSGPHGMRLRSMLSKGGFVWEGGSARRTVGWGHGGLGCEERHRTYTGGLEPLKGPSF